LTERKQFNVTKVFGRVLGAQLLNHCVGLAEVQAPGLAWFIPHMWTSDVLAESEPERSIGKEVLSFPAPYSGGLRHRHERFENDAIQTSKERNDLLPWRRRAHEVLAETTVNDFVPDSHDSLTPLDFVARQFRNAFEKWAGQHNVRSPQFKQPVR
jgi:hypothetical protein